MIEITQQKDVFNGESLNHMYVCMNVYIHKLYQMIFNIQKDDVNVISSQDTQSSIGPSMPFLPKFV